jgi:hypothetical protein
MNSKNRLIYLLSDNYDSKKESCPDEQIIVLCELYESDKLISIEDIYEIIKYRYGLNKICRHASYESTRLLTILDTLVHHLAIYQAFDEISHIHYPIAKLIICMVRDGAKCARDMSYSDMIRDYNQDQNYSSRSSTILFHSDSVKDSYLNILISLGCDMLRFEYMIMINQINPYILYSNIFSWILIFIDYRNSNDIFNPIKIINLYHKLVGINYQFNNGDHIIQKLKAKLNNSQGLEHTYTSELLNMAKEKTSLLQI